MKQILLSFTLLSVILLTSCSDQIQAPASSGPERIVYTTLDNSQSAYIPSVYSLNTDGTDSKLIADPGVILSVGTSTILWNARQRRR